MKSTIHRRSIRLVAGGAVAVMAVVGTVLPAGASSASKPLPEPKPPAIVLSSVGTFSVLPNGAAAIRATGDVNLFGSNKSKPAVVRATLKADDGTLPTPETCESGVAGVSFRLRGEDLITTMLGHGQVCGVFPQHPTSIVTYVFTGTYKVLAGKPRLVGTDGWFEVRLADDGTASVLAFDS